GVVARQHEPFSSNREQGKERRDVCVTHLEELSRVVDTRHERSRLNVSLNGQGKPETILQWVVSPWTSLCKGLRVHMWRRRPLFLRATRLLTSGLFPSYHETITLVLVLFRRFGPRRWLRRWCRWQRQ